jgi:hypothetical protein
VIRMSRTFALLLFCAITLPIFSYAQAAPGTSDRPFVVEYYYKAKWGHADEFLKLFKKNHYPAAQEGSRDRGASRKCGWISRAITPPKTGAGTFA